jgi:hypothetical protein
VAWPQPGAQLPHGLAEAINLSFASMRKEPPRDLTERDLTFSCDRGDHRLAAVDAEVSRSPTAVVYRCPRDGAELVRICDGSYRFADGDLTVDTADGVLSWWDYTTVGVGSGSGRSSEGDP